MASFGQGGEFTARSYWVYIMASGPRGVLYIGMTSDLPGRTDEHRERSMASPSAMGLIEKTSPTWRDLFAEALRDHGFAD